LFGTLLSVYVRDVLQSNAALFGTLNSLIGFGMIAGTQSVRRIAMRIFVTSQTLMQLETPRRKCSGV
jgi:hypothetical protein